MLERPFGNLPSRCLLDPSCRTLPILRVVPMLNGPIGSLDEDTLILGRVGRRTGDLVAA